MVQAQNHASGIKKADVRSYLWQGDCPLPTFIYPGFDCGSGGQEQEATERAILPVYSLVGLGTTALS